MTLSWKEQCKEYEKRILSYLIRDVRYVDRIMMHGPLRSILELFADEDCKYVFNLIYGYRERLNEILIKEAFKDFVDNDCSLKKIEASDRVRYLDLFDEIIEYQKDWKPEQFNQIKSEWFQVEVAPKFSEVLRDQKTNLDSCKTFRVFDNVEKIIGKYKHLSKIEDGIDITFLKDYLPRLKREFNESRLMGLEQEYIKSGLPTLDRYLVGFGKGKLSLIGGRSSSGKTTLAINIATNMMRQGKKILFVSLEMSKKELANMIISRVGKIPYDRLVSPVKNDDKWTKYINKIYELVSHDLCILKANAGAYTWSELETQIENKIISEDFKPDAVFIDYLALIGLPQTKERRDVVLGDLTKQLRTFAEKYNTALAVLVQANRQSVTRDPKTGKLITEILIENIEDSNKIGQDADLFMTINQVKHDDNSIKYEVWVRKQRGGKKDCMVTLESQMNYQWITDHEAMYNEPLAFGSEATKEEIELYRELVKVNKKESENIGTGIDEDDTPVSEEDFEIENKKISSTIPQKVKEQIEKNNYDDVRSGITLEDLENSLKQKEEKDLENSSSEINMFSMNISSETDSGYMEF